MVAAALGSECDGPRQRMGAASSGRHAGQRQSRCLPRRFQDLAKRDGIDRFAAYAATAMTSYDRMTLPTEIRDGGAIT